MRRTLLPLLALAFLVPRVIAGPPAPPQDPKLVEGFEDLAPAAPGQQGPPSLVARGWIFRNQSAPVAAAAWRPGGSPGFPQAGSGFLGASSAATGTFGAALSSWAILPPVPGQAAGDALTIWALDGNKPGTDTFLELRYSPSGGTGTGSGPQEVGDFTQVLFAGELPVASQFVYAAVGATLPGPGRVALRFHAPAISNFQSSATLWLDSLVVGGDPVPSCGLPLPAAGETLSWTQAGSPYTVCQDLVVPEGATLVLEPGASVVFAPGASLIVEGGLWALGTQATPVTLDGDNVSGLRVEGEARLEFAVVGAWVGTYAGASLEAFDCSFEEEAWLSSFGSPSFQRLERCELRSAVVGLSGTSVLEEVLVFDPAASVSIGGFWRTSSLQSFAPLLFRANLQDRVIDGVSVTGVDAPALELHGTDGTVDFHLGAGNVLVGNRYPVWPRFAGLSPDSTVPLTGNVNDAILGFDNLAATMRGRPSLPDLGLPYHFLERGTATGRVAIAPGAELLFGPQGGLSVTADRATDPVLRGLPGQPIRFAPLVPGQRWLSVASLFGLTLFEHLDVTGAGIGVVASGAEVLLRDCTISDCALGATPSGDGHLFGSGVRFLGNDVGLRNDTANLAAAIGTGIHFSGTERPNLFEGNAIGAENVPTTNGFHHEFPADGNWWGDPSGPFEPNVHPAGMGDPVSWVDFQPFLAVRPDLGDERPVVRLRTRLHPVVLPGERLLLEWDAWDDGTIVGLAVQMLDPDVNAPYGSYVTLVPGLAGGARRCEVTVPDVGLHPYERFPFRIAATDDAGNVGFEQFQVIIPSQAPGGSVAFHTPLVGLRGGEDLTLCYDALGLVASFPRFYVETANDDRLAQSAAGSPGTGECSFGPVRIPFASTDRARIALRAEGNFNRDEWYFTDWFTIRPDPRLGDAPPTVALTAPLDGEAFAGGGTIPIAWTASDDVGLQEFRIQASFNGGHSYHTMVPSLPPTVRSYAWRLPTSAGIDDVRLRVVAVDTLLQNSADGDERVLRILPGEERRPRRVERVPLAPLER